MRNQKEIERINRFICLVSPIVAESIKNLLRLAGLEVSQQSQGLSTVLSIEKDDKQAKMYLHNLLLEIATIDRDEEPLRFDARLRDFNFFTAKTVRLTQSKLKIFFHLFAEEDMDAVIENISQEAKDYERIRIWQFDRKNQTSQEKQCQ